MTYEIAALLFAAGLVGGAVSAIAGGSGLITFPMLLAVGLPPTVANATNFVSVLFGNLSALPAYLREIRAYRAVAFRLVGAGLAGGALGSALLVLTTDVVFLALVPWLLATATVTFALGDWIKRKLGLSAENAIGRKGGVGRYVAVFLVSIYGGYFGAGLGVILLATLFLTGFTKFHEANALKNLVNAMVGLLGVAIYAVAGLISWQHALVMMAGSGLGGYAGVRLARFVPERWLARAIVVLGIALTVYYFLR